MRNASLGVLPRTFFAITLLGTVLSLAGCSDFLFSTVDNRNAGIKQYNDGQYAEAAGTFRNTLRANPADYGSLYFLGACMHKMGSYELAIEKYKACLVLMDTTMVGRDDRPFRQQCLNSLASAFVASGDRNVQSVLVANSPAPERQFLLAKIYRGWGDADAAIEAYSQASLLAPKDFDISKEFGIYLAQLGQNDKARNELRLAYALNAKDPQVEMALRSLGVVPGPSLKNEKDMAKPLVPLGPIPEMEVQVVFPASDRTRSTTGGPPAE